MNTPASTKVEQLLPCPFCGGEAALTGTNMYRAGQPKKLAVCRDCGACADADLWNTRATLTPAPSGEGREWMPIESAPKDGTFVDLWQNGKRRVNCRYGRHGWQSTGGWIANGPDQQPTHWMPLPAAPHKDTSHD